MATVTKTPKTPAGQLNSWDAEMAKSAVVAAKAESKSIERPFFSMGNGSMALQGAAFPGNVAAVIALADIHANLYYEGAYDPNKPASPACFAYARTDDNGEIVGVDTWDGRKEMAPHKDCTSRQHTDCATCPMNQFASARIGKGKACQNTRRVGLIPGGTFVDGRFTPFTKPDQIENATVAYLKLPTMSVKGFSAYVTTTANALQRPTWGIFSKLERVPDPKAQYLAQFTALASIPNALMDAVFKRMKEVKDDIAFPFMPMTPEVPAPKGPKGAPGKRKYS